MRSMETSSKTFVYSEIHDCFRLNHANVIALYGLSCRLSRQMAAAAIDSPSSSDIHPCTCQTFSNATSSVSTARSLLRSTLLSNTVDHIYLNRVDARINTRQRYCGLQYQQNIQAPSSSYFLKRQTRSLFSYRRPSLTYPQLARNNQFKSRCRCLPQDCHMRVCMNRLEMHAHQTYQALTACTLLVPAIASERTCTI